jgi:hypothetical protein
VGTHAGVECRFYFEPSSGRLEALESFLADGEDPCEVYFEDYQEENGRWWPRRLVVCHGDLVYDRFAISPLVIDKEGP